MAFLAPAAAGAAAPAAAGGAGALAGSAGAAGTAGAAGGSMMGGLGQGAMGLLNQGSGLFKATPPGMPKGLNLSNIAPGQLSPPDVIKLLSGGPSPMKKAQPFLKAGGDLMGAAGGSGQGGGVMQRPGEQHIMQALQALAMLALL